MWFGANGVIKMWCVSQRKDVDCYKPIMRQMLNRRNLVVVLDFVVVANLTLHLQSRRYSRGSRALLPMPLLVKGKRPSFNDRKFITKTGISNKNLLGFTSTTGIL